MIFFGETQNKKIFTTGAFLQPMKIKDVNGNDYWIWAVEKFEDTSYYDGYECNPLTAAKRAEDLLIDKIYPKNNV